MQKVFFKEWTNWVSIIISFFCFWLGNLSKLSSDENTSGIFSFLSAKSYNWIVEQKNIIVFAIILVLFLIQYINYQNQETKQKKWLKQFLEHLTNQHLSGGNYNTRITLFRVHRGYSILVPHFIQYLKSKSKHPSSLIPNPIKQYLTIYVRYCTVDQPESYTFFRINRNSRSIGNSMVAECYRTGEVQSCQTDTIIDIKLCSSLNQLNKNHQKRVKKYMSETKIIDYDTLYAIKSPSNSILTIPIKRGTKCWGVLVFDHTSKPDEPVLKFPEKIDKNFQASYQKIIQFTTEVIK